MQILRLDLAKVFGWVIGFPSWRVVELLKLSIENYRFLLEYLHSCVTAHWADFGDTISSCQAIIEKHFTHQSEMFQHMHILFSWNRLEVGNNLQKYRVLSLCWSSFRYCLMGTKCIRKLWLSEYYIWTCNLYPLVSFFFLLSQSLQVQKSLNGIKCILSALCLVSSLAVGDCRCFDKVLLINL